MDEYASEQFTDAVRHLLHGDSDRRDRLAKAIDALASVTEDDMTADDLASYSKVRRIEEAALTKGNGTNEQRLRVAIDDLSDDDLTNAIWAVYFLSRD